jgi:alpha-amylase
MHTHLWHYKTLFSCIVTALILSILVIDCTPPAPVDMEYNRGTFVKDWRDEVIYQIMVDRFADGDKNNNFRVNPRKEASYHGGDWQGIIDRLNYLEDLGVTALWISPVVRNVEEDAGFSSYHGYWTQSFIDTNPHFGDLHQLQQLVDACHRRNIKVILDVVTNHIGQLFYYDINRNGQPDIVFFGGGGPGQGSQTSDQSSELRRVSEWDPEYDSRGVQGFTALGENGLAPLEWVEMPEINRIPPEPAVFQNPDWYNRKGRVTVWEDTNKALEERGFDYLRDQEIKGDFPGGLKDLATHRPVVQEALIEVFAYWIQQAGFDGFRIDTLKHQDAKFFDVFAPNIRKLAAEMGKNNFLMFGEAFDGSDELLGSYTHGKGVDSVFYFSAYYQVFMDIFAYGQATNKAKNLFEQRQAALSGVILEETARRLCQMYCDTPQEQFPADYINCEQGIEACITQVQAQGLPRYQPIGKINGPVDVSGNTLASSQLLINFIDNHDVPRFLYSATPKISTDDSDEVKQSKKAIGHKRLRNALVYLLSTDGIPCIYYGTEQNFAGGPDPSNREDMWHSNFDRSGKTYLHVKHLIKLRKQYVALRRGDMIFRWTSTTKYNEVDGGLLAFERLLGDERVLVVINTREDQDSSSATTQNEQGNLMSVGFAPNTVLRDALHPLEVQTFTVDAQSQLLVTVPHSSARVLVIN